MTHHSSSFTEIMPAYLVKGVAIVQLPDGGRRRVQVARIVPAPTPEAARIAALRGVARRLQGSLPRWKKVSARWIANQYMWTFDEESAPKEAVHA